MSQENNAPASPSNFAEFEAAGGKYTPPAESNDKAKQQSAGGSEGAAAPESGAAPDAAQRPTQDSSREGRRNRVSARERIAELSRDKGTLQARLAELEAKLNGGSGTQQPSAAGAKPDAAANPNAPAKPDQPARKEAPAEKPKRPKLEDFEGKPYSEFQDAYDEYIDQLTLFNTAKHMAEFKQAHQREASQRATNEKFAAAKQRYGDGAETTIRSAAVAIVGDSAIDGTVKQMLNDSPLMMDLLHRYGAKKADLDAFVALAKSDGRAAIAKIFTDEAALKAELAKGGAAGAARAGDDDEIDDDEIDDDLETPEEDEEPQPARVPQRLAATGGSGATRPEQAKTFAQFEVLEKKRQNQRKRR